MIYAVTHLDVLYHIYQLCNRLIKMHDEEYGSRYIIMYCFYSFCIKFLVSHQITWFTNLIVYARCITTWLVLLSFIVFFVTMFFFFYPECNSLTMRAIYLKQFKLPDFVEEECYAPEPLPFISDVLSFVISILLSLTQILHTGKYMRRHHNYIMLHAATSALCYDTCGDISTILCYMRQHLD